MRYDLKILWAEDSVGWRREQEEIINVHLSDLGLSCEFIYHDNGREVLSELRKASEGFKAYDLFFIDYELSSDVYGDEVIDHLRNNDVFSDILFYSQHREKKIRELISENSNIFEGIYVANRDYFIDKCLRLIEKSAKQLLSLSNVRGLLLDYTSENDFTIKSYLLACCSTFSDAEVKTIRKLIVDHYKSEAKNIRGNYNRITDLAEGKIDSFKSFFSYPASIVPLRLHYLIFEALIKMRDNELFANMSVEEYLSEVNSKRNKLAHSKMEICKQNLYIKIYDNFVQYQKRKCPNDCSEHNNEGKLSKEEWDELRKLVFEYTKTYDQILETQIILSQD